MQFVFFSAASTLYKILNDCAASVRKCVEGLDYYVAEGSKAFQTLEAVIDKVDVPDVQKKTYKQQLLDAKRYIKTDFKVVVFVSAPELKAQVHYCDHALSVFLLSSVVVNFSHFRLFL